MLWRQFISCVTPLGLGWENLNENRKIQISHQKLRAMCLFLSLHMSDPLVNFFTILEIIEAKLSQWSLAALCCLGIVLCSPHSKGQERTWHLPLLFAKSQLVWQHMCISRTIGKAKLCVACARFLQWGGQKPGTTKAGDTLRFWGECIENRGQKSTER